MHFRHTSSSSGGLTNFHEFPSGRSDSSSWNPLFRRLKELVDWEVLTSTGTEVRVVFSNGLSPVLLRRNVWGLEGGTRGLLLPCHGTILTKSNIQRRIGRKTSVKCECKFTLRTTYTVILSTQSKIKDNSYPLWAVGSAVGSAPMLSLLFLPLMLTLKAVILDSKTYKLDSKRSW